MSPYRPRRPPGSPPVFPIDALLDALAADGAEQLACWVGVSARAAHRWIAKRMLTAEEADEVCTRAGLHPSEVWGDLWWATPEQEEDDRMGDIEMGETG